MNEINEGCNKILPVSGSFWSNFSHNIKFFNLSSEERAALENLSKCRDIIVKAANKGGALVVLRANFYKKKKLCYNFLTLLFYAKVDKDLTSTDQQIVKISINDLIVNSENGTKTYQLC